VFRGSSRGGRMSIRADRMSNRVGMVSSMGDRVSSSGGMVSIRWGKKWFPYTITEVLPLHTLSL
jgi:hypothetical protein